MADTDLIAPLYPYNDIKQYAKRPIEHARRFVPAKSPQSEEVLDAEFRRERESTEPPRADHVADHLPHVELRFSSPPPDSRGFTCGTSRTCCLRTPYGGISRVHWALTYKQIKGRYYLIVRDLNSTHGTMVTYDGEGGEVRRKFDWIVGGGGVVVEFGRTCIHLSEDLKFQIMVTPQDRTSPAYIANVERFIRGSMYAEADLDRLDIKSSTYTMLNSWVQSPTAEPILINRGCIGSGAFGVVTRHWNVSTDEESACKRPVSNDDTTKRLWRREVDLLSRVKHVRYIDCLDIEWLPH